MSTYQVDFTKIKELNPHPDPEASFGYTLGEVDKFQLDCQQRYIHCVNTGPSNLTKQDRLEKCIMGKK